MSSHKTPTPRRASHPTPVTALAVGLCPQARRRAMRVSYEALAMRAHTKVMAVNASPYDPEVSSAAVFLGSSRTPTAAAPTKLTWSDYIECSWRPAP